MKLSIGIIILLIGLIVGGLGTYFYYRPNSNQAVLPTPTSSLTPTPIPTPSSTPSPSPTPTSQPVDITVDIPVAQSVISSPLHVSGKARGTWFFEAQFPVKLVDASGKVIASGVAKTSDNWMTTDFVSFNATLNFTKPATDTGQLILSKDNPSGLPQNDASITVAIRFK